MARRISRHAAVGRPLRVVRRGALVVVCAVAGWLAPQLVARTSLRDLPLVWAFGGIDGSLASGSARWTWLDGIEYRDVVLRDRAGRPVVVVPLAIVERGILRLAWDPRDLGAVRVAGAEVLVEVRPGGSSLEDILAPWLAGPTARQAGPPGRSADARRMVAGDFELVDATVEFIDAAHAASWRMTDLLAAGTVLPDGGLSGWTAAGRLRLSAGKPNAGDSPPGRPPPHQRLDRSTVPAAAAAVLARDGGWSVSSPGAGADGSRLITVAAHRLPLGWSGVLATRLGGRHLADGIADVRLDLALGGGDTLVRGRLGLERFALCDATSLAEVFAVERCDVPLDLDVNGDRLVIRSLAATSPLFRAEAAGRIRLPTGDLWQWAESLVSDDFSLTTDVDLAVASRGLPVRPDVRLTAGRLQLAATARGDGDTRILEVKAAARDVAAACRVVAGGTSAGPGEEQRTWPEPLVGWVKASRGPARGATLRIDEARVVSRSCEVSASGDAGALGIQWAIDLGELAADIGQLLDLGGTEVSGRSRGRLDLTGAGPGTNTAALSASVSGLTVKAPGRPTWSDDRIALEAECRGSASAGVAVLDSARVAFVAADDRLEASLTGGVLVDVAALAAGPSRLAGVPSVRPAALAKDVAVECTLAGDLGRWQARLAGFLPGDVRLGGTIDARVAAVPDADAWRVTRAGGQIEKLAISSGGRDVAEPRVVASAAGTLHPASGRLDITAGELLSPTLSLRTGGLSWIATGGAQARLLDRLRGRLQWQVDVGRLESWLVASGVAAAWPASGRAWGTVELIDTPAGTNLLVEGTGSQLAVVEAASSPPPRRQIWSEPRVTVAVEITRGGGSAERLTIDRVSLESSTLSVAATGSVTDWSSRRTVALDGAAACDWDQLSRLLVPWTGGRIRLAGVQSRPFAARVPLVLPPPTGDVQPAEVQLPSEWLDASPRVAGPPDGRTALVRPVARAVRPRHAFLNSAIDTSLEWSAGEIDGLPIAAGSLPVRLLEGQVALGPFDVAASGGRLRGAPWIRFEPAPAELIVPPGRIVERVALSGAICDRCVGWLSPLLGHATHTTGAVSVDLAGARLPLADPFAGEAVGQMTFEALEMVPAATMQPLVGLLVKLQSAVDPRFAVGDKTVLLRVRPEPVRFRLGERRISHEGLVMDAGQFVITSRGSVGSDGSLAMVVEVALRGDVLGATPVVGQLVRTPLVIPLKGTVERPQFDAGSIDLIVGRIVENTAEAVIRDGIGRGLESLLGSPAAAPLTLPPR